MTPTARTARNSARPGSLMWFPIAVAPSGVIAVFPACRASPMHIVCHPLARWRGKERIQIVPSRPTRLPQPNRSDPSRSADYTLFTTTRQMLFDCNTLWFRTSCIAIIYHTSASDLRSGTHRALNRHADGPSQGRISSQVPLRGADKQSSTRACQRCGLTRPDAALSPWRQAR